MDDYQSLSHTKWECKFHVVFLPKCRRKVLYGALRSHLGSVFRTLAEQKECRVEEGHLMPDHVHMMISIPPKWSVAQIVGYIKGKSAIHITHLQRTKAQLRRAAFLGARLLRLDRRKRRSRHSRVHPQPGGRGQAHGSTPSVVATRRHLQVAHRAARERPTNQAALSGSRLEFPRLCRGIG